MNTAIVVSSVLVLVMMKVVIIFGAVISWYFSARAKREEDIDCALPVRASVEVIGLTVCSVMLIRQVDVSTLLYPVASLLFLRTFRKVHECKFWCAVRIDRERRGF